MKIGLISYHREPNYGTMLQAYALAEAIKQLNCTCEYIDYYEMNKRSLFRKILGGLFNKLYRILNLPERWEFDFFYRTEFKKIRNKFKSFHSLYIPRSSKEFFHDTIYQIEHEYDYFIVGSDQTWSKALNQLETNINFLQFVRDTNKKRSYAPSIGTTTIDDIYKERLKKELFTFKYLSCRERPNCNFLSDLLGREVEYVLDPTLLLNSKDWDKIAATSIIPGDYILAYILGEKQCISDFAEKLGQEYNLPVYYILTRPYYLKKEKLLDNVGPTEFLSLIKNAKYVITDSFHGSIFSINYKVNFYSFSKRVEGGDNDRIITFLRELDLEERYHEDSDMSVKPNIDFDEVHIKLNLLRETSQRYLKKITEN